MRLFVAMACLLVAPSLVLAQGPIEAGQTVQAELTDSDPGLDDGRHHHLWTYRGRAGERLVVTMRSEAFDTYLTFGTMRDGAFETLSWDDDGGGGTDSRLQWDITADGTYLIRAHAFSEAGLGPYTLTVESRPTPPLIIRPISPGEPVGSELTTDDPTAPEGPHYQLWRFTVRSGDQITVTMRSGDFDAYISVGHIVNGALEYFASDDDSGGGTDAMLELTADRDGDYVIRATSFNSGATGSYTLLLTLTR